MSEKIYLNIPYVIKDAAKILGAKYDPDIKKFYVEDADKASQFKPVYMKVPYEDKDIVKEQGCLFDRNKKCWYTPEFNYSKNTLLSRYQIIA